MLEGEEIQIVDCVEFDDELHRLMSLTIFAFLVIDITRFG